jgi:hypothetical protein
MYRVLTTEIEKAVKQVAVINRKNTPSKNGWKVSSRACMNLKKTI